MNKIDLKKRWGAPRKWIDFTLSEFGLIDNFLDFRGIEITDGTGYQTLKFCDFSFIEFIEFGGFNGTTLSDCKFHEAKIKGNFKGKFTRCSFKKTTFRNVVMVEFFQDCDFSHASLNRAGSSYTKFLNCNFTAASFKSCDFSSAIFEGCNFTDTTFFKGDLESCKFINCIITPEQLKECRFLENIKIMNGEITTTLPL